VAEVKIRGGDNSFGGYLIMDVYDTAVGDGIGVGPSTRLAWGCAA